MTQPDDRAQPDDRPESDGRAQPGERVQPEGRARLALVPFALGLVGLSIAAWAALWALTPGRATEDTLRYYRQALGYLALPEAAADDESWRVFARYAEPSYVELVVRQAGGDLDAWHRPCAPDAPPTPRSECISPRWLGIFEQRPVFPAILAAARLVLGEGGAPAAAVYLAVAVYTLAVGLGIRALGGTPIALITLALGFLNPLFSSWLVHLSTDGLGIGLYVAALCAGALLARRIAPAPALILFLSVLVLAFTRHLALAVPVALAASAVVAGVTGRPGARGYALGTGLAALPVAGFAAYVAARGMPGLYDQLQDVPTRHFQRADAPDILVAIRRYNRIQAEVFLATLGRAPYLALPPILAAAGFLLRRADWVLPFLAGAAAAAALQLVHPIATEAPRVLAPVWVTVHLGIALFLVALWERLRVGGVIPGDRAAGPNQAPGRPTLR